MKLTNFYFASFITVNLLFESVHLSHAQRIDLSRTRSHTFIEANSISKRVNPGSQSQNLATSGDLYSKLNLIEFHSSALTPTDGEVQWTSMDCGDIIKIGEDDDHLWYIRTWLDKFRERVEDPQDRIGLFFTGGQNNRGDFEDIVKFNQLFLGGKGKLYFDVHKDEDFYEQGLNPNDPAKYGQTLYWRAVYRASKSLAAGSSGGTAYVYMKPNNCRNIFSMHSQAPKDVDPTNGNRATNGEVWYFSELPTLMRNLHINKVVAFYKKAGTKGEETSDFVQDTQWDINEV